MMKKRRMRSLVAVILLIFLLLPTFCMGDPHASPIRILCKEGKL